MKPAEAFPCTHDHCYLSDHHLQNERRTWAVIALTAVTMVVEIFSGWIFGSMALLADGWHMMSHASAFGITAFAFFMSRRHQNNPRFTFGTGKIGDLAGFSSALLLSFIAVLMAWESILRMLKPVAIHFDEAIWVAILGLAVNLVSALLLKEEPQEHHHHGHPSSHAHPRDHDHNLRAAYLHVLADALTSVLAIFALSLGKFFGWSFLDPVMGIVGALVIARWSYGLMMDTGAVLLDWNQNAVLKKQIAHRLEKIENVTINDLHIWRLGPDHYSAVVSLTSPDLQGPAFFKRRLASLDGLSHLIVEVNDPV